MTRGTTFSTYAVYWIREEISRNIRNIKYSTWIPEYLVGVNRDILRASNDLSMKLGREATDSEISDYTNETIDYIRLLRNLFSSSLSLNECIEVGDDCIEGTLLDSIEDETTDVYNIVCQKQTK